MGAFARNRNGKTDITIYKLPRREGSVCATLSSAFGVFLYVLSSQMNIMIFHSRINLKLLFLTADSISMRDAYHIS